MNFALLRKAKTQKEENKEFDIIKYLNKTSTLQKYMDVYMINDPIELLDSAMEFDKVNCFGHADPVISLKQMFGGTNGI